MKVPNSNEIVVFECELSENCKTSVSKGLRFRYFVEEQCRLIVGGLWHELAMNGEVEYPKEAFLEI